MKDFPYFNAKDLRVQIDFLHKSMHISFSSISKRLIKETEKLALKAQMFANFGDS